MPTLPEMTLPAPDAVPPIVLSRGRDEDAVSSCGSDCVPVMSVPMLFPSTRLPGEAPSISSP